MSRKLKSALDASVNWTIPYKKSLVECRYVRRKPEYISGYLSSHNGCRMKCKFCWLTATQQYDFNHVTIDNYANQLNTILSYAKKIDKDNSSDVRVNINMMSRGEPMANKYIIKEYPLFHDTLQEVVSKYNYGYMKINVSSIFPHTIKNYALNEVFQNKPANIYYSIYSINENFRQKWLPNALPVKISLDKLKAYQFETDNPITFHFAVIKGENDNLEDVKRMANLIDSYNFTKTKLNIVGFNPNPTLNYEEGNAVNVYNILSQVVNDTNIKTNKSRIVDRVGQDVYASCGMFINK